MGCDMLKPPTGPTPPELSTPNELYLENRFECNALLHQLDFKIEIYWAPRRYATLPDGRLGIVACSAGNTYVKCDQEWVNAKDTTREKLNEVAAHESCHIIGDLREPPTECMTRALDRCRR